MVSTNIYRTTHNTVITNSLRPPSSFAQKVKQQHYLHRVFEIFHTVSILNVILCSV